MVKLCFAAAVFWLGASTQFALAEMADRPPDTMAARTLACAPCHGAQGEGSKDVYFRGFPASQRAICSISSRPSRTAAATIRR